jgi:hypothetical protein
MARLWVLGPASQEMDAAERKLEAARETYVHAVAADLSRIRQENASLVKSVDDLRLAYWAKVRPRPLWLYFVGCSPAKGFWPVDCSLCVLLTVEEVDATLARIVPCREILDEARRLARRLARFVKATDNRSVITDFCRPKPTFAETFSTARSTASCRDKDSHVFDDIFGLPGGYPKLAEQWDVGSVAIVEAIDKTGIF